MNTLSEKLKKIKYVVFDCDGVFTDGKMYMRGEETPSISFNVRDGLGIKLLHLGGVSTAVITGRKNDAMKKRAQVLKMGEVIDARIDKGPAIIEIRLLILFYLLVQI